MSFERVFKWTCDSCGTPAFRSDYGLPRGWIFAKGPVTTNHCPACRHGVDRPGRSAAHADDPTDEEIRNLVEAAASDLERRNPDLALILASALMADRVGITEQAADRLADLIRPYVAQRN